VTDEEIYNYKTHTIRGRLADLTEECEGAWTASWWIGLIVVAWGIVVDVYNREMWLR